MFLSCFIRLNLAMAAAGERLDTNWLARAVSGSGLSLNACSGVLGVVSALERWERWERWN